MSKPEPDPVTPERHASRADRSLGILLKAASLLVLPLALLLFLQWPLREIVQAYSREANDLAQILFALYIGFAITAATREKGHLAVDALARRYSARTRLRLERITALLVLLPWSSFVLWKAWPSVLESVRALESFPETYNPGYFLVRAAVSLLALVVLLQCLIDAFGRPPRGRA